jgi:hypothetical protein
VILKYGECNIITKKLIEIARLGCEEQYLEMKREKWTGNS